MCCCPKILSSSKINCFFWERIKTVIETVGKSKFKKKGKNQVIDDPVEAHEALRILEKLWNDQDAQDSMDVTTKKDHFIFEFETNGAMKAKLALDQALKALDSHCNDFMSSIDAAA